HMHMDILPVAPTTAPHACPTIPSDHPSAWNVRPAPIHCHWLPHGGVRHLHPPAAAVDCRDDHRRSPIPHLRDHLSPDCSPRGPKLHVRQDRLGRLVSYAGARIPAERTTRRL